jgi:arsenite/tail-anchored protein-transporting ATPase
VPELAFFIGKGGVGKTTLSAAYAIRAATRRHAGRVLLISTDPAHSLADVLQAKLRDAPAAVAVGAPKLTVWQMNPGALFRDFLRENKRDMLTLVERGSLFTADEISPLLDTALPGMSEITGLLAIHDAVQSGKYSGIVVDTAPFGHTLRLFELVQQFERLLNFLELSAGRDQVLAAHFGGNIQTSSLRFVEEWRGRLEQLKEAFARAALYLVTAPEKFALNESVRCVAQLQRTNPGMQIKAVVLNCVVLRAQRCPFCKDRVAAVNRAAAFLRQAFRASKLYLAEDHGFPVIGTPELRKFAERVFSGRKQDPRQSAPPVKSPAKRKTVQIKLSPAEWPLLDTPLSFVLGKGGVGKTTVSAGLGFQFRRSSRKPVQICSVDPAPSLDDIFLSDIGDTPRPVLGDRGFRASELDSVGLYKGWVAQIKGEIEGATTSDYSGVHVDLSFERRLFSELLEIVPPGLDEVLAIFRIVELAREASGRDGGARVIVDMAPTGHALELLRTPERILVWTRLLLKTLAAHRKLALAREAAVRMAELELHARELSEALKNSKQARIFSVMLAEPLPDRETERLIGELEEMGLSTPAIFVNRMIFAQDAGNCPRCRSAIAWQESVLADLQRRYPDKEIFVVRNFAGEIAGRRGLQALTSELWRLN